MHSTDARVWNKPLVQSAMKISAIVLGAILIFVFRRLRPAGFWELIALAAAPVVLVAVVGRSRRDTLAWAAYMASLVLFSDLRAAADDFFPAHTDYVIELERLLFFGAVPSVWLQERFYVVSQASWFDWTMVTVHLSYFMVPHAVAFLIWAYRPQHLTRYLIAVIATYYGALVIQALIPTVPPWLASETGHIGPVTRIVQATLSGEAFSHGSRIVGENDVAAMPSLHTAITVLAALMLAQLGRAGAWIGWLNAVIMAFALIYLGEHYAVDAIAGAVVAVLIWRSTRPLAVRRQVA